MLIQKTIDEIMLLYCSTFANARAFICDSEITTLLFLTRYELAI
jgi:hypothetical protein